jgi:hypothetical protein
MLSNFFVPACAEMRCDAAFNIRDGKTAKLTHGWLNIDKCDHLKRYLKS